jgi:hypothetical protein
MKAKTKTPFYLFAYFALLTAGCSSAPTDQSSTTEEDLKTGSLIRNGGFELDDGSGTFFLDWSNGGAGEFGAQVFVQSDHVHSGKNAAEINTSGDFDPGGPKLVVAGFISQTIKLPTTGKLTLSFFASFGCKAKPGPHDFQRVRILDRKGAELLPILKQCVTDPNYTKTTVDLTSLRGKTVTVEFFASDFTNFDDLDPKTDLQIDDVRIVKY